MSDKTPPGATSRRDFVAGLTAASGMIASGQVEALTPTQAPDPTRVQGAATSAVGARSPHETLTRLQPPGYKGSISLTPLESLHGTLTPADLHFERHHGGVPQLDPAHHELLIHGMVNKALKFSLDELKRFPSVTRTCFIECSGNLNTRAGEKSFPQMLCGLTSQSEWTGVALGTLLREVGVKSKASWFLAEGSDAALMARSIPLKKAWDDALIVYAQNGEAIRPEQGYPIRLLLPGWEGNTNVKWLRRIELSDAPFMTREETSKYTDPLKNDTARLFSVIMDARSIITSPTFPHVLEKGWHEVRGIAWSGRGRIETVEVSVDGGRKWQIAQLQGPVLDKAHTRFTLPWKWDGHPAQISSRTTDETGYVQPTMRQLIDARGPGSQPYHLNSIMSWTVQTDGQVLYNAEPWI
ncbi:MAG: sulfite dehydrogenase [Halieaceae bacterium]|nr:sulfite dehydrogenase [Halieaceae bacterium]